MQDTRNMAAANSLARLEHEAGFWGKVFHEGSANWKTTWTTG